jgi:precorrin-2 dehydrogenase / sirohydrochlorin ferrochelatase
MPPNTPGAEAVTEAGTGLFPVFLKLQGRSCLVVGAGNVALSKIEGLLASGAEVRVVAPQAVDPVITLAQAGEISWWQRSFEPADLDGVFLAIVATSNSELNGRVFREAQRRNILCNVVDDPPHCDFYYPSVVRRGDLQIAISTNGRSPALAQRLRRELEEQFGPEYEVWLNRLGIEREKLFRQPMDPELRRKLLHKVADRKAFEEFMQYHREPAIQGRE